MATKVPVTVYGYAKVKTTIFIDDTVPFEKRGAEAVRTAVYERTRGAWEVVEVDEVYDRDPDKTS